MTTDTKSPVVEEQEAIVAKAPERQPKSVTIDEITLQRLIDEAVEKKVAHLNTGATIIPDGVLQDSGGFYREVTVPSDTGPRIRKRRVSLNLEEARATRTDYYHPQFGWIIEGYKLAKDRDVLDIMADTSVPMYDPAVLADSRKEA